MGFNLLPYQVEVSDEKRLDGFSPAGGITSGVLTFVYGAGTKTLSTIYADDLGTSRANPITRSQYGTDGMIKFWSASTSHDIVCWTSDGYRGAYASLTPNIHALKVDRSGHSGCLVAAFGVSDNVETDTGLDYPLDSIALPVSVQVVTSDATETLDVGLLSSETNGDADGLSILVPLGTVGYIKPWVVTVGSNETYVSATYTGALMGLGKIGTDAANDCGIPGGHGHVITGSNAKSLTYTGTAGTDTGVGYIFAPFRHLR